MDDAAIIDKVKQDAENFRLVIKKYQELVLNYIYGWIWDRYFAEDLTQETFIALYKNLGKYDKSKSLKAWLLTIARNKSIDYLRYNVARKELPLKGDLVGEDEVQIEEGHLKEMMDGLDKKYKEVLLMYYWQELTYKEIAEILGISINTVKTRLKRAKDNLKTILKNEGYEKYI